MGNAGNTADPIRAAGGVVWRPHGDDIEIVIVHRPKYDDWSLPKGKLDPGESWEEAAVREVLEETGLHADLGPPVARIEYFVRAGRSADRPRPKVVHYWAMRSRGGAFTPHAEVDAIRWRLPTDALGFLTHQLERDVVQRFVDEQDRLTAAGAELAQDTAPRYAHADGTPVPQEQTDDQG